MSVYNITEFDVSSAHPLAVAVIEQLGGWDDNTASTLIDVANNGADRGFSGFIYFSDTCDFTTRHRQAIADAVEEMAEELGEDPIRMVQGFRCVDDATTKDVAIALYVDGSHKDEGNVVLVENALAWFALEEVGHAVERLTES